MIIQKRTMGIGKQVANGNIRKVWIDTELFDKSDTITNKITTSKKQAV